MESEKAAFQLEEDRLKRLETQLEKCTIWAPDDGMVVYANDQIQSGRGGGSPQAIVEEGASIRERQSIIKLPDLSHMQVKCTIHESKVDSLQRGMRARIQIQDHEYQGVVTSIANQPEPSNWYSGNVKEYAAIASIDSDPHGLRPGMTAAVEILVADLPDVLTVPVQAVVEQNGRFSCWVNTPAGPQKRPVVLGMSNNTRIEIQDGLSEGEDVLLNPRATVEEAREDSVSQEKIDVKSKFGGDKPVTLPQTSRGPGPAAERKPGGARPSLDIKSLDKDHDGKVSKEELPERMQALFESVDTSQDGFVDAQELAEFRKKMQQMQQQGGDSGGPGGGR